MASSLVLKVTSSSPWQLGYHSWRQDGDDGGRGVYKAALARWWGSFM